MKNNDAKEDIQVNRLKLILLENMLFILLKFYWNNVQLYTIKEFITNYKK